LLFFLASLISFFLFCAEDILLSSPI
jgi:hypothetical protein